MGISLTRHWVSSKSTLDIQKDPSLLGTGSCLWVLAAMKMSRCISSHTGAVLLEYYSVLYICLWICTVAG